ncbi:MAG: hypothetical protein AVDCRST_MAG38-2550 [uncultured Solirubrobacteraceae bacterium]|uniref:Uncharacterized protein n=1 Tax=uncultured Solirubrobacteraceae bacterium TaxID=1162706 RepID=A0A6J4S9F7_9ACTN|nr:MAG: hypothetical protein AVDCRST_MAG38-2550 [uncultured Solirubrobacteraceae bacterium]
MSARRCAVDHSQNARSRKWVFSTSAAVAARSVSGSGTSKKPVSGQTYPGVATDGQRYSDRVARSSLCLASHVVRSPALSAASASIRRASVPFASGMAALRAGYLYWAKSGVTASSPLRAFPAAVRSREYGARGSGASTVVLPEARVGRNTMPLTPSPLAMLHRRLMLFRK